MSEDKESKTRSPAPPPEKQKESGGKGQRYYLYEHELNRPVNSLKPSTEIGYRPRLPFSKHDYPGIYPTPDEAQFLQRQFQKKLRESQIYSRPPDTYRGNSDHYQYEKSESYDVEGRRTYYNHHQHDDRYRRYDGRSSHMPFPSSDYYDDRRREPHYKSHSDDNYYSCYNRKSDSVLNGRSRHYEFTNSRRRHSYESSGRSRSRTREAEGQTEPKKKDRDEHDLNTELHPLMHFIDDRPKLLKEATSILKGKKLAAMTPPIFAGLSQRELENLCLTELETLNIATIANVIDGKLVNAELANKVGKKSKVISVKKIKKQLKESLTESGSVKKKKRNHEDSVEGPKIKKIKKAKKHKKKKKKSKAAADEDEPAGAGLPSHKTLMELLELEYRAKAIKALLKSQDINSSMVDDALLDEPDLTDSLVPLIEPIPHSSVAPAESISHLKSETRESTPVIEEAVSVTTTTEAERAIPPPTPVGEVDVQVPGSTPIAVTSVSIDPVSAGHTDIELDKDKSIRHTTVDDDQHLKADCPIVIKQEVEVYDSDEEILKNLKEQLDVVNSNELFRPIENEMDNVALTSIQEGNLSRVEITQTEGTVIQSDGVAFESEEVDYSTITVVVEENTIHTKEASSEILQTQVEVPVPQINIKIEIMESDVEFKESEELVEFQESEKHIEFQESEKNIEFQESEKHIEFQESEKNIEFQESEKHIEFQESEKNIEFQESKKHIEFQESEKHIFEFQESMKHIVEFQESKKYTVEFHESEEQILELTEKRVIESEESELEEGECDDEDEAKSDLEFDGTLEDNDDDILCTYVRQSTDIPVISPPVVDEDLPSPKKFRTDQKAMSHISASDVSSDESIGLELLADDGIDIGGNGEVLADSDETQFTPIVYSCDPKPEDYEEVSQSSNLTDNPREEYEDDEDANPRTWFNRWYNSKKVQKNVKSNRVIGKLRSKLRREKQIPDPLPPVEPTEAALPIIGSIDEYKNLFSSGKFKADPREDSTPSDKVILPLGENVAAELPDEEDDAEALWSDIIG